MTWLDDWEPGAPCRVRHSGSWGSAKVVRLLPDSLAVEIPRLKAQGLVQICDSRNIKKLTARQAPDFAQARRIQLALDFPGAEAIPLKPRRIRAHA